MPSPLSTIALFRNFSKLKCCLLLILSPLFMNAQTLTGLWVGALSNDSTTVRRDKSFEIVLTEYKGKVYGYSRSEFIVDDALFYIVKRVKGTIEGEICEVTDDELIACNFPKRPEKGVKVTSIFRRNGTDGEWYLDGTWKTNQTKNYYSISGKVSLAEEKDLTASRIFPHLEELKIADNIAFYKERKEGTPIVKLVKPERDDMVSYVNPALSPTTTTVSASPLAELGFAQSTLRSNDRNVEPQTSKTSKVSQPEDSYVAPSPLGAVARNDNTAVNTETSVTEPEKKINPTYTETNSISNGFTLSTQSSNERNVEPQTSKTPKVSRPDDSHVAPSPLSAVARNENAITKNEDLVAKNNNPEEKIARNEAPVAETFTDDMNVDLKKLRRQQQTVSASTPAPQKNIQPTEKKEITAVKIEPKKEAPIYVAPIPKVTSTIAEREGAALAVNERRTEVSQVVSFKSDSLQIALYDNGQIDGDTVSVLMNGEVILSKQGLKATAIKHTIYLAPGVEEFNIVLYAENLGTLPPNTGLVVVRDGTDVYNLRFSSDYQKNTGIVFRRKK
jgi:hypothetical protein